MVMKNRVHLLWFLVIAFAFISIEVNAQNDEMVKIKGGFFLPLYGSDTAYVEVEDFKMDVYPVTHLDFQKFVKDNPKWRKSEVLQIFAADGYLKNWKSDLEIDDKVNPSSPVNNISWFAAKAYCETQGKRLPTVDEWEYAAMADEEVQDARKSEAYNQYILSWYETPQTHNRAIGSTYKNYWGVYDLHGIVWEWTSDFNSVLLKGEAREGSNRDAKLFCGAAAINATDLMNYAAFMRYAFRGSLKANYSGRNLGFRCAESINQKQNLP